MLCCTCSIYHLALISLDRYLCVRFPIAYPTLRTSPRTILAIFLTWVWCAILAMPRLFGWKDAFVVNECEMRNKSYMLFSSLVSFYIPLFLIMCMYVGIYRATQARARRFRRELLASQRVAAAQLNRKSRADSAPALPIARIAAAAAVAAAAPAPPLTCSSKSFSSNTASPVRRTTGDADLETIPEATVTGLNNSDESRSTLTRLNPHDMELLTPEGLVVDDPEVSSSFLRSKTSLLRNVRYVGRRLATFRPLFLTRSQTVDWLSPPDEMHWRSRRYSTPVCDDSNEHTMLHSEPNLSEAHQAKGALGEGRNGDSELGASTGVSVTTATTTTNQRVSSRPPTVVQRTPSDIHRRQRKLTQAKLKRRRQKQESRTARVVLIVLGAFVIFWAPFFVLNVVLPWCGEACLGQQAQAVVWRWAVFWGYINSAINPIIYTFFNRFGHYFINYTRVEARILQNFRI